MCNAQSTPERLKEIVWTQLCLAGWATHQSLAHANMSAAPFSIRCSQPTDSKYKIRPCTEKSTLMFETWPAQRNPELSARENYSSSWLCSGAAPQSINRYIPSVRLTQGHRKVWYWKDKPWKRLWLLQVLHPAGFVVPVSSVLVPNVPQGFTSREAVRTVRPSALVHFLKVNRDLCRGIHHSNRFCLALKLSNVAIGHNEGATCMSQTLPIVHESEASGALQSSTTQTVMAWCCLHG